MSEVLAEATFPSVSHTLTNQSPGGVYRDSSGDKNLLKLLDGHGGPSYTVTLAANYDSEKVSFEGFTGGVPEGQQITGDITFKATFTQKEPPVEKLGLNFKFEGASPQNLLCSQTITGQKESKTLTITNGMFLQFSEGTTSYKIEPSKSESNSMNIKFDEGTRADDWGLEIYAPFGYSVEGISYSPVPTDTYITTNTEITLKVKEAKGSISGRVWGKVKEDEEGEPLVGCLVNFYDVNGNLVSSTKTIDGDGETKGTFTLENIPADQRFGNVYVEGKDVYCDSYYCLNQDKYRDSKYQIDQMHCWINGNLAFEVSEHVDSFILWNKYYDEKEKKWVEKTGYLPRIYLFIDFAEAEQKCVFKFNIDSEGALICSAYLKEDAATLAEQYKIIPVFESGYSFGYWNINGSNYGVGDVNLDTKDGFEGAVYASVPGGDTPTGDVTYSAKTYDELPFGVVIALILVAGASAFVVRKRIKD